jgi:methylmalonyl-CoA mutase N-terminal domain/subunit
VGTNKYRLEHEDPIDILEVDNTAVRKEQEESLESTVPSRTEREGFQKGVTLTPWESTRHCRGHGDLGKWF